MTNRNRLPHTLRERGNCRGIVGRARRALAMWSFVTLVAACSCAVRAVDVHSSPHPEKPVVLRRIFVPADDVGAWPIGGEKFLPIESAELEDLIAKVNGRDSRNRNVLIAQAEYSARLQGDRLIGGTGQWRIELRGQERAFLPLPDLSVNITSPRWKGEPERSALIGAWGANSEPATDFGLEVARSGTLEFDWSAPLRDVQNGAELRWSLPSAVQSKLTLDLPAGKTPTIEGGIVLESDGIPAGKAAGGAAYRRWVFALGPKAMAALRIVDTQRVVTQTAQPQETLREEATYRITARGLEITATLLIDPSASSLRELHVPLPSSVQLISAIAQDEELSWHVVTGEDGRETSAVVSLPAPPGEPLTVTLHAWQPLVLNRAWQFPRLQPAGLFWTSGDIEVALSPSLELQRLAAPGCVQIGATAASGSEEFERYTFRAFEKEAAIEVVIAERQTEVLARLASMFALSEPDITAQLVSEISVNRGSLHTLIGELAEGWVPEAIETVPSDALGEWFLDETGGRTTVEVQLAQPATANRAVTIKLTGRLQRSALSGLLSRETLRMVRWRNVNVVRHLLSVETVEPYVVEPMGNLPEVPRSTLANEERDLFESGESEAPIFDLTEAAANAILRVGIERPQFSAEVTLDLAVHGGKKHAAYHVFGRPSSSRLDRIVVFFTQRLDAIPQWNDQSSGTALVAKRLSADDRPRVALPAGGEAWMVRLARPTARPVHVVCTLPPTSVTQKPVPLPSLPEAERQQGRVLLRTTLDQPPVIEQTGLRPIPFAETETASHDEGELPVRTAFRYEPARCQDPVDAPTIRVGPYASRGVSPLFVRRINIESFYQPTGRAHHRATYLVDNHGGDQFRLPLPDGAKLSSVNINGMAVATSNATGKHEPPAVALPRQAISATITATFETTHRPMVAGIRLMPPLAERGVPICAAQWNIWLPKEYSLTGSQLSPASNTLTWRERLFGFLARRSNDRPFHPLRAKDWQQLANPFARSLGDSTSESPPSGPAIDNRVSDSRAWHAGLNSAIWMGGFPAVGAVQSPAINEAIAQSLTTLHDSAASLERLTGWHMYRADLFGGHTATVMVAREAFSIAWAAAGFLLCLVVGRKLWSWNRDVYLITLAISAACALLFPVAFAPIATGAFIGMLLSLIVRLALHQVDEETPTRTWSLPKHAREIALMFVLLTPVTLSSKSPDAAANATREASHEETSNESTSAKATHGAVAIRSVLIPMDAEGRPVGSKHYVSERFLSDLIAAVRSGNNQQWVLLAANYVGELREAETPGVTPGNFSMLFTIEVLARDTKVVLPLKQAEADWATAGTLDGIPIPIEWSENGQSCTTLIAEPGRYQLALSCVPHTTNQGGRNQIALTVSPMVGATIRLQFPKALSEIYVANATMMPAASELPGTLVAQLHGTEALQVAWPDLTQSEGPEKGVRVTEMRWVRASPNAVELETKWIFEGSGPRPEMVTVTLDDRWELMEGAPLERSEDGAAGRQTVQIPLAADDSDRHELSLRWRWTGDSPLGNVQLPNIKLSPLPLAQRWVAISSAPEVDCEMINVTAAAATANEFLALWGEAVDSSDQLTVLANVTADSQCVLAVRPRTRESSITETLDIAARNDGLQLHYQADVEASGIHEFQLPLDVSKDIVVDEITVLQGQQLIPLRWSRPAANSVIAFFVRPVEGEYRIEMRGHVAMSTSGNYAVPHIGVAGAEKTKRVQLYRDERVLAEVRGLTEGDFTDSRTVPASTPAWTARPLAAYQFDDETFSRARLVVTPNNVQTSGQTLTTLSRESDGWWATYSCDLLVERGVLDSLPLGMPANWPGPFQIESQARTSIELQSIDDEQNRLVVRLADSVTAGGTLQMQIRARVASDGVAEIAVPEIKLQAPLRGRHLVLVPSTLDGQPFLWTQVGVRRVPLPRAIRPPEQVAAIWQLFEVVSSPFRIAQRTDVTELPAANVRLADVIAAAGPLGNQLIVARMALITRNLTECTLQISDGHELVSASLDGRPALIRQREPRVWQLSLGPPQLPQWLEIVTRSAADERQTGRRIELVRPRLYVGSADVPVEISLWSFQSPWRAAQAETSGADIVPAVDQAALRLDRLVSIVESATPTVLESPAPDGFHWYGPWADRLVAIRQAAFASANSARPTDGPAQVTSTAEEQLASASERLDAWIAQCVAKFEQRDNAGSLPGTTRNSVAALGSADSAIDNWVYCVADGGGTRIVMELDSPGASPEESQLVGLIAIIGAAVAAIALVRHPAAWNAVCRWPHALVTISGIAYWAWLWPSWLGLLIALAGVVTSLLPTLSGRLFLGDGSTVLRSGRSL